QKKNRGREKETAVSHHCSTLMENVRSDQKQSVCVCVCVCVCFQVSFARDFEQQLSFGVEARATFCNLEPVIIQLIHVRLCLCVCVCVCVSVCVCVCVCVLGADRKSTRMYSS